MRTKNRRKSKAGAVLCILLSVLLTVGSMTANGASASQVNSRADIAGSNTEPAMTEPAPESDSIYDATPESREVTSSSPSSRTEPAESAEPPSSSSLPEESEEPEERERPAEEPDAEVEEEEAYANSISGMLWLDVFTDTENDICTGDGIRQAEESPLAGYGVYLYAEHDMSTAVQTATTDADGRYSFKNLEPGSYVAGVVTTTVGEVEYLLPLYHLDGTQGDNRFVAAYDADADAYLYAFTTAMEISEGTVVSGVDGGMRTPPGKQTMAAWTVSGDMTGSYSSLSDAISAILLNAGSNYDVTTSNTGSENISSLTIPSGKNVTISSEAASPLTLYVDSSRHFFVYGGLVLKNIVLDGSSEYGGVRVNSGGKLDIQDGAVITRCYALGMGGGVYCSGTFTMTGGTISDNTASGSSSAGGGVYCSGTFTMTGGTISHNDASGTSSSGGRGGGVYVGSSSTINCIMQDGTISGNKATTYGGGIFIGDNIIFSMEGGTVSDNTASSPGYGYGGGVCVYNGTLKLSLNSNGKINENKTNIYGGGVFVSNGMLEMNNGEINRNETASNDGGGVHISAGNFTMFNGEINHNVSAMNGGGVTIRPGSDFDMKGGTIRYNTARNTGGGVFTYDTFEMNGGVIADNTANFGGGVGISSMGKFTMRDSNNGSSIVNNTSNSGGGVYIASSPIASTDTVGGTFEMENGEIRSNKANTGAGVYVAYSETNGGISKGFFTMNAGTICNNEAFGSAGYGGGVCVNGEFKMSDNATIKGNKAHAGGGVFVSEKGVFYSGGEINSNESIGNGTTGGYGGGVCNYGLFKMTSGEISGNSAETEGGGLNNTADGTFEMSDGKIISNTAKLYGGGVRTSSNKMVAISGGKITGNTAMSGGGIYTTDFDYNNPALATKYANISITGTAIVSGNTAGMMSSPPTNHDDFTTRASNSFDGTLLDNDNINYRANILVVYIANNGTNEPNHIHNTGVISGTGSATFTAATHTALGFSASAVKPIFKGWNTATDGSGTSYDAGSTKTISDSLILYAQWAHERYLVYNDSDMSTLLSSHHWLKDAVDACGTTPDTYTIIATEDDTDMSDKGGSDSGPFGSVNILANKSITLTSDSGGPYIMTMLEVDTRHMEVEGSLTLEEITLDGRDGANKVGGGIEVDSSGRLSLQTGAAIQNCSTTGNGGGVYVRSGTFTMNGGRISGNTASGAGALDGGGGAYVIGSFTMSGGEIEGNSANGASSWGGGVYITGTFNMEAGKVSNNTAYRGGGVYGLRFNMSGGEISGNMGSGSGGGVYCRGAFTISGGEISGNTGSGSGGGAFCSGNVTLSGGKISGNTAHGRGGGIYCFTNLFEMSGGEISDNSTVIGNGGGVYCDGEFKMSGGKVSGNTARGAYGGGVCCYNLFTMSDGEISGNVVSTSSSGYGGGVYIDPTSISTTTSPAMTGGKISDNRVDVTGSGYGGGVCFRGTLNISGGEINGNTVSGTSAAGGGIYCYGTLNMTGGKISHNEANNGGGICIQSGYIATISDTEAICEISDNRATQDGGGIYNQDTIHANLTVNSEVVFSRNSAQYAYQTNAAQLASAYPSIQNTYPNVSLHTHPLNNYDINRALTGSITVEKYDTDGVSLLDGVTFTLERLSSPGGSVDTTFPAQTLTTGAGGTSGTVKFDALPAGSYQVTETQTPTGYEQLIQSFEAELPFGLTLPASGTPEAGYFYYSTDPVTGDITYYYYDLTYKVSNQAALVMPSSGATGAHVLYLLAGGLLAGSAALGWGILWRKRRKTSVRRQYAGIRNTNRGETTHGA